MTVKKNGAIFLSCKDYTLFYLIHIMVLEYITNIYGKINLCTLKGVSIK